jgi:alpha-glucosidase
VIRALGQRQLFNMDRPEVHDVLRRWRAIADSYPGDRVLLGEAYVMDLERLAAYYGDRDELHLAFNFLLLHAELEASAILAVMAHSEPLDRREAWPAWAGSNHDAGRLAARWAHGDGDLARCALMLLLLLRGTPVLYYGDELALPVVDVPPEHSLDPGLDANQTASRDGSRTPMPWHGGPGAGFTRPDARPWLPIGDATTLNVAEQLADPHSVLNLCRDLIALRHLHPELHAGDLELLDAPDGVVGWRRGGRFHVYLNLGDRQRHLDLPRARIVADTRRERQGTTASGFVLPARSGIVCDTSTTLEARHASRQRPRCE